jgi:hypothetical protein
MSTVVKDQKPEASSTVQEHHQIPAPNGGLRAWLQVLGAHFFFFNSW